MNKVAGVELATTGVVAPVRVEALELASGGGVLIRDAAPSAPSPQRKVRSTRALQLAAGNTML